MTSEQIAEWYEYYILEPWGERSEWLRTGILASMVGNASPNKRKGKPFVPEDFMPREIASGKKQKKQTHVQLLAAKDRLMERFKKTGQLKNG